MTDKPDTARPVAIAQDANVSKQEELDQWQQRAAFDESIYNDTVIRWRYWVEQMPQLSAAEAARLMSALDPDLFKSLDHRPNKNDPTKRCEKAAVIQRLAERQGMQVATPTEWLAWAIQEEIKVHDGFRLAVESLTAPVVTAQNKQKKLRRDSIDPVIELAQTRCRNPQDTAEVWGHMVVFADDRHTPFLMSNENGLQYSKKGINAHFTRDALDKRLHPDKRATPGKRR